VINQTDNHAFDGNILSNDGLNKPTDSDGISIEEDTNAFVGEQQVEKKTQPKPRRFTYQSGSTALDGYTIKRGIGIGGFGEVYFAISDAGKEVALKRIQRNLDVEIRGVSQCLNLKHINLISLWDIRQDAEGESWVVMEYVPGESLRDVLERNPNGIPLELAKKWFSEILAGVNYLHDHGIVHRDLKPGNIFYDQDEQVVKIGDYGLSKFISTSKRDGQTESVGTFHYMAPEIGKGSYGKEIDIYSLGIILCEILAGQVPFDGESGQEIIMKHLTASPDLDFVPQRFRSVIAKTLAKDPELRFSSVQDLEIALDWDGNRTQFADKNPNQTESPATAKASDPMPSHARIEPMFIRDDEPMYISDDEIQLGDLNDHSQAGSRPKPNIRPVADGEPVVSNCNVLSGNQQTRYDSRAIDDGNTGHDGISVISTKTFAQNEPIAKAVNGGFQRVANWWNGVGGTPFKIALATVVAILVLVNAQWLIPLSVVLGCSYMLYYFVRAAFQRDVDSVNRPNATVIRPFSRRECAKLTEQRLRERRFDVPFTEKLAEALGSILVATVIISVSALIGLGFSGYELDGSVATISLFTWIVSTSLIGTTAGVVFSKLFESKEDNQWKRRFFQMTAGVVIGIISYFAYHAFLIESIPMPRDLSQMQNSLINTDYATTPMKFILFFAVYFAVIRWWKVGDPLRKSQFSIVNLILHTVIAVGVGCVTGFPLLWAVMIGGTISISLQMSTTWINSKEREKLQFEVMQSEM
jgi:serine/threonine protein kinase